MSDVRPVERFHVRHAAAEVVDAISRAVLVMAATALALLVVAWIVMVTASGSSDFPEGWLFVVVTLVAAGVSLRLSADGIRTGSGR